MTRVRDCHVETSTQMGCDGVKISENDPNVTLTRNEIGLGILEVHSVDN